MKLAFSLLLAVGAGLVSSSSVEKRAANDADILNYALTLEHLEAAFYEGGLKNYTHEDFVAAGCKDPFYSKLKQVGADEKAHVRFLTKALSAAGANPVEACRYSFPSADVKSFLALANVLEGVGVSAYLGAAAHIANDTYLTAAGSILSVEARHSAYLRAAVGEVPFPEPFDTPLDFNEVYTVASPFIVSCPSSNPKLPVKAFPSLTITSKLPVMAGSKVTLMAGEGFQKMNASNVHAAFITVTGPVWAPLKSMGHGEFTLTIPKGIMGQSYVVLTEGHQQATDDNILAGPAIIEVGAKTGGGGMMMPTSTMSMPSSTMGPSSSMWPTSSMPWTSSMATGSMSSSGVMPVFTGGAGKLAGNIVGAIGAALMGVVIAA